MAAVTGTGNVYLRLKAGHVAALGPYAHAALHGINNKTLSFLSALSTSMLGQRARDSRGRGLPSLSLSMLATLSIGIATIFLEVPIRRSPSETTPGEDSGLSSPKIMNTKAPPRTSKRSSQRMET